MIYRFLLAALLALINLHPLFAGYQFLGNVQSLERLPQGVTVTCDGNHRLKIEFLRPEMFRVTLALNGETPEVLDYAILPFDFAPVSVQFSESETGSTLKTTALLLEISKRPCRLTVRDLKGFILNQDDAGMGIGWDGSEVRCWKTITPDEKFLGLGEKTGDVNKRGREYVMWNADWPAYEWRTDPLYQSIPFYIGLRGGQAYGIFFNNSYRTHFNMGASNNRFASFWAEGGPFDYIFFYGPSIADVVEDYTSLTGRMPLPPLWSLGYQQCRWSYFPESEVMTVAQTFREKKIPADAIYFDIHHMDGYRVFTWDPNRFPQPGQMLGKLNSMGFHAVTIIDPGVKADSTYRVAQEGLSGSHFVRYPDGETYIGEVWPGPSYFPDFSNPQTRDWWGGHVGDWLALGVSGVWNDMNEPAVWGQAFPLETVFHDEGRFADHKKHHNLYGFLMAKATYEGALKRFPDRRPFILTRAGFAGEQRYTAVWTGDNVASWDQLELGIRMMQGLGVSGVPFVGTDVGGFIGTPSKELFARWVQFGALSPLFRTHTEYGSNDQEPWSFGENVEGIARDYISLRYQLLPYMYSLFHESSLTGAPPIRPLCWNDQADERTFEWAFQQQVFLGDKLMAAPVTREGQYLKEVYLPRGQWVNWNSGSVYSGGQTVIVKAPLEVMPMFLREGAIIPMQDVLQHTGETSSYLYLDMFPSRIEEAEYTLYEDDGESFEYRNGKYRTTQWTCARTDKETRITQTRPHDDFARSRELELRLYGWDAEPHAVSLSGKTLTKTAKDRAGSGFFFDTARNVLTVRFADDKAEWRLTIRQ